MESPAEEKQELAEGFEGTPEDKKEDEELGMGKEVLGSGSGGFVTDRDQSAEPKPVEKAEIPVSKGEAAIKASARKPAPRR